MKTNSIQRILLAYKNSYEGLKYCFTKEAAFNEEVLMSILILPLSFIISSNHIEWLLLIITYFIVLILELINTAIEKVCDAVTIEHNQNIKLSKDIASAAVFMGIFVMIIVWLVILFF